MFAYAVIHLNVYQDDQCQRVHNVLDDAQGFVRTNEQDRFDQCEEAVNGVLQDVRRFGQQVKVRSIILASL